MTPLVAGLLLAFSFVGSLTALYVDWRRTERELARFDAAIDLLGTGQVESVMDDSVDSPPSPEESRR